MTRPALPDVVDEAQWRSRLEQLLPMEKAATRLGDAVAAARRRLPMVAVGDGYTFTGADGRVGLLDLFGPSRQLLVYHFMTFAPEWQPCPGCSRRMDDVGNLAHLLARDTAFAVVAVAPYPRLRELWDRKSWTMPVVSSAGGSFNADMGATTDDGDEQFGFSAFVRDDARIYRTYWTTDRGVENAGFRHLLDMTVYGRQEDWESSPAGWPQTPTYGWGSERDE